MRHPSPKGSGSKLPGYFLASNSAGRRAGWRWNHRPRYNITDLTLKTGSQSRGNFMASTFLLQFQERHDPANADEINCGTKTVTETRETRDPLPSVDAAIGTKTLTKVFREQSDEVAAHRSYKAVPIGERSIGAKTGTATRETRDQSCCALSAGTMTGTRAREESDQDESNRSYTVLPVVK